jgi:pyruvate/2-oxoglutarate/acetoin dehydrogenase E1 component
MEELDAPVKRVTAPDTCIPSSPILEDAYMPDEQKIMEAVRSLL